MGEVNMIGLRPVNVAAPRARSDVLPEAGAPARKLEPVQSPSSSQGSELEDGPRADVPEDRERVHRAATKLRERLEGTKMDLRVKIEEGHFVFELVDTESGQVVRRIPPKWFATDSGYEGLMSSDGRSLTGVIVDENG